MPVPWLLPLVKAVGPSIVGAVGGLFGGAQQRAGQRESDERYNQNAIALQNLTNKQNIEFWKMQNQYNDPSMQMARLREAGLNPNLLYGQGASGATGTAGPIAPSKTPDQRQSNLANQFNVGQVMQAGLQAGLVNAQREKVQAETAETIKKTFGIDLANEFLDRTMQTRVEGSQARDIIDGYKKLLWDEKYMWEKDTVVMEQQALQAHYKLKKVLNEAGLTLQDDAIMRILTLDPNKIKSALTAFGIRGNFGRAVANIVRSFFSMRKGKGVKPQKGKTIILKN